MTPSKMTPRILPGARPDDRARPCCQRARQRDRVRVGADAGRDDVPAARGDRDDVLGKRSWKVRSLVEAGDRGLVPEAASFRWCCRMCRRSRACRSIAGRFTVRKSRVSSLGFLARRIALPPLQSRPARSSPSRSHDAGGDSPLRSDPSRAGLTSHPVPWSRPVGRDDD